MAAYAPEPERSGTRHQAVAAAAIALAAIATLYLNADTQEGIARVLQASVLRPFIWTQETLLQARMRADQIEELQGEVDSLTSVVSTQAALADENRTLRDLLGLAERAGPSFLPATVIRAGTSGAESTFLVDVGREDGVEVYAPVVSARGLVGRIIEVRASDAVAIDWTNPDFRVSAMLEDGTAYGLVRNVRREFREEDRLLLDGTAYHETLRPGERVLTSGLGGTYPRGITIGWIDEVAEEQGTWLKSYWMRPSVEPGAVTHVLVARNDAPDDVTELWAPDSIAADGEGSARGSGP